MPSEQSDVTATIASHLRKTSLVPIISDFLFVDAPRIIKELSRLNAAHDVFLIMVDARFAYRLPDVSAGWIETFDVETGRSRVMSRGALRIWITGRRWTSRSPIRTARASSSRLSARFAALIARR